MKLEKSIYLGVLMVLVVGMSADTYAQGRGGGKGGRGQGSGIGSGRGLAVQALGLSTQQQEDIALLRAQHREVISSLEDELDVKRAQMAELMTAERLDRQAIEAKRNEMEPIRQELRDSRHKHRLDMLELLTPEQRTKWLNQKGLYRGKGNGPCAGWGRGSGQGLFRE